MDSMVLVTACSFLSSDASSPDEEGGDEEAGAEKAAVPDDDEAEAEEEEEALPPAAIFPPLRSHQQRRSGRAPLRTRAPRLSRARAPRRRRRGTGFPRAVGAGERERLLSWMGDHPESPGPPLREPRFSNRFLPARKEAASVREQSS